MSIRPYLLVLPLVALGCAEATPAPVTAMTPAAEPAPVTEVNLDPPAAPSAKPDAKPGDKPDLQVSRAQALKDAADFSLVGLLNAGAGGDPNAPTTPWGADDSLSARGNMWGDQIGDSFGVGGLGLAGTGPSAGSMG
ncbi:MAG: hypothetical protein ABI193_01640, partial [Minicystis sp.]